MAMTKISSDKNENVQTNKDLTVNEKEGGKRGTGGKGGGKEKRMVEKTLKINKLQRSLTEKKTVFLLPCAIVTMVNEPG